MSVRRRQVEVTDAYGDELTLGSEYPSDTTGHTPATTTTAGFVAGVGGPASSSAAAASGGGGGRGPSVDPQQEEDYLGAVDADVNVNVTAASLRFLCEKAGGGTHSSSDPNSKSWEDVRSWLLESSRSSSSPDDDDDDALQRRAAEQLGEFDTTPLHLACRNRPPVDVLEMLLNAAPDTVRWVDSFGWLPLHYACANGASDDVLRLLTEAYPEGTTSVDRRGRTPLHFALGNTVGRPATSDTVRLLGGADGAGRSSDENGMLPLHYACAYGASEEALAVLTDDDRVSTIVASDKRGRTPLHFALGNCDRPFSPAVVRLLLTRCGRAVDAVDHDNSLPLKLLANRAYTLRESQTEKRANAKRCLLLYIGAEPRATADFLTALQALPDWLGDAAVIHPVVQSLLNDKISQKIPTAIVLFDLYVLLGVTVVYYFLAVEAIENRFPPEGGADPKTLPSDQKKIDDPLVYFLYFGALWSMAREALQIYSLVTLGLFKTWATDMGNYVDVGFFVLSAVGGALMQTGGGDSYAFRRLAALTIFLMWVKFLSFLRSIVLNISVFLKSFMYVLKKLASFMIAVIMILIMSAQAFQTMFLTDHACTCTTDTTDNTTTQCSQVNGGPQHGDFRPFCGRFGPSFIKVYTMLLGEVDDNLFHHPFQVVLFAAFMFFAVVLLAQVLIAIVTDSYGVISTNATIVFWSNRLERVAEMDAIVALLVVRQQQNDDDPTEEQRRGDGDPASSSSSSDSVSFRLWKRIADLFEDDIFGELSLMSSEFWCYVFIRTLACVIVPLWLLAGVATAGLLWPPQIRAMIFVFSRRDPNEHNEAERRAMEMNEFRTLMKEHQDDLTSELAMNKRDIVSMKSQMKDIKVDVATQLSEIKQIMTEVYELQLTMDTY
uniref:Ion transport domain-containing protein n=1 Tax=Odontella aurita TaxID=265563 RepID=A0A7S4J4N8_9STRA|mmetsp:Transcript_38446/g.115254  ORF Transcript_38446/g.115254 Transcript_38446/m.115254 type:complete len:889 (+) Transcript_38446:501-3167(+)